MLPTCSGLTAPIQRTRLPGVDQEEPALLLQFGIEEGHGADLDAGLGDAHVDVDVPVRPDAIRAVEVNVDVCVLVRELLRVPVLVEIEPK